MANDDDYVEGDSSSAPADAPGVVPADDAPAREASDTIDSASVHEAPIQRLPRSTARNQSARKAFAEAIAASKTAPPPVSEDLEDPEDVALAAAAAPAEPAPEPAAAADAAPVVEPPAPSLHPEVLKLKQQLAADREAFEAERAAAKKAAEPPPLPDAASLEDYIDSPAKAYRVWMEAMRGEKMTDDEYKSEVSDFITQMSADVMGVPLPDNVRTKLDAAQARKIVKTHKSIQAKKEAALSARLEKERADAATKAETERVEQEWSKAAEVLGKQFSPLPDAAGKPVASQAATAYPWLAAEDEPGKLIVDVIRAAVTKDGTQLSWQEASKKANDYLAEQAKRYYDKRKPLLAAPAAVPAKPAAKTAAPAPVTPAPLPEARVVTPAESKKWNRDRHLENSKAAFRQMIGKPTT